MLLGAVQRSGCLNAVWLQLVCELGHLPGVWRSFLQNSDVYCSHDRDSTVNTCLGVKGPGLSRSSWREKGKQGRTFKTVQKMGRSRCWGVTLPVSLLRSSLTGLAADGSWNPACSTLCPCSGSAAHPGLGAVCFLSALSSFYLWQSQVLWANRQAGCCKDSTTGSSDFVILC